MLVPYTGRNEQGITILPVKSSVAYSAVPLSFQNRDTCLNVVLMHPCVSARGDHAHVQVNYHVLESCCGISNVGPIAMACIFYLNFFGADLDLPPVSFFSLSLEKDRRFSWSSPSLGASMFIFAIPTNYENLRA